jgi:RNA 3'-terminal phosphate cyclase (ATP)
MADFISLDGGSGEGGGQILRTALALSIARGIPFEMTNIRARRPRPGLQPQHLAAVRAATLVSAARVHGASDGSKELRFEPAELSAGEFDIDITTAGSCSLVLQTVAAPLALAGSNSRVRVTGGTHVSNSPSFHFLAHHWAHAAARIGFRFEFTMGLAGFYPRGGGVVDAVISPAGELSALNLESRGQLLGISGYAGAGHIKDDIAGRLRAAATNRLWEARRVAVEWRDDGAFASASPGSHLMLRAEFAEGAVAFAAVGEKGRSAELLGDRVARDLLVFLGGEQAVDPWLADQLAVPMALSGKGGRVTTSEVTPHLTTVAEVLSKFGYQAATFGRRGGPGGLEVGPFLDTPADTPG